MPGQVAVSQATAELVVDDLPDGFRLQTLGVQQLRDLERPESVFVVAPVGEPVRRRARPFADAPRPDSGSPRNRSRIWASSAASVRSP